MDAGPLKSHLTQKLRVKKPRVPGGEGLADSPCPLYVKLLNGEANRFRHSDLEECLGCEHFPDCWNFDHFLRIWNLVSWSEHTRQPQLRAMF